MHHVALVNVTGQCHPQGHRSAAVSSCDKGVSFFRAVCFEMPVLDFAQDLPDILPELCKRLILSASTISWALFVLCSSDLPHSSSWGRHRRFCPLPASLGGGRGDVQAALLPPQRDERVHGPHSWLLRRTPHHFLYARLCYPIFAHHPLCAVACLCPELTDCDSLGGRG